MGKKRRRSPRKDEMLSRDATISAAAPLVRFSVKGPKDPEPEIEGRPWLELRGRLSEPIRGSQDVVIKLWSDPDKRVGPNRPLAVAYITAIRPQVEVIGSCAPNDFTYVWSLALSGHLKQAHLYLTKPHYSSASVLSMSFSKELEE